MSANAVNGSVPTDPPPYLHNQILDASRIPPARGDLSASRQTLNEPALANLSDRERLTGFAHPDDLCGSLAHHLGTRHSNAFLTNNIRVLDYAVSGTYNTSNYIVARVNEPRKRLRLTATARPKARSAKDTPPMRVFVLMDQGQHAGQWMRIVIDQTGFNVSTMTPAQIQSENLNARLTTLRTTPGAQPALPARNSVQQGAQPAIATVPAVPSAAAILAQPAASNPNTTVHAAGGSNLPAPSLSLSANRSTSSTQHQIHQQIHPSLQSTPPTTLPLVQQNATFTPSSTLAHASTPADSMSHLDTSDTTTSILQSHSASSSVHTDNDGGSSAHPMAPAAHLQTQTIAQTRPTLTAVQARKRRINDIEDQEGSEVSSPKRLRKDSGPVGAATPLAAPIARRITPLPSRQTRQVEAMNPLLLDPLLGGSTQSPRVTSVLRISKRAARRQRAQAHTVNTIAHPIEALDRIDLMSPVPTGEVGQRYTYALPSHGVRLNNPLYVVVPPLMQAGLEQNSPN